MLNDQEPAGLASDVVTPKFYALSQGQFGFKHHLVLKNSNKIFSFYSIIVVCFFPH